MPSVFVALFDDYGSREIIQTALRAELQRLWGVGSVVVDLQTCASREAFLASPSGDLTWLVGIDIVLDRVAPWLNALRDELARRRAVLWIPRADWHRFARSAPDLVSYAVVWEPALVGGVVPADRLEPQLFELERRWKMTTQEFLQKRLQGKLEGVPDDEVHLWGTLADILRR